MDKLSLLHSRTETWRFMYAKYWVMNHHVLSMAHILGVGVVPRHTYLGRVANKESTAMWWSA